MLCFPLLRGRDLALRVLIADDEPAHVFLLEMFLKKWGYDVISTDSGTEAWQILRPKDGPRLAILDWEMPGMGGLEICEKVRKAEEHPYIYILLLTARAQQTDILKGTAAGADAYVTKPYDPEELRGRLLIACRILESADLPPFACP